jgi:hypothetical protein
MVDHSSKGKMGKPFEIVVEKGKILEFAEATHSSHVDYCESDNPLIPPTFLTTMMFWEKRVEESNPWDLVKMDPKRGMHGEQEYTFFGPPPRAGTRLICQSRIESIEEKKGRRGGTLTFVDLVTQFTDLEGNRVAEARMRAVETGKAPQEEST